MAWEEYIKSFNEKNAFTRRNYMRLVSMDKDTAVAELDACEDTNNFFGIVHGGALFTLADMTAGNAIRTDGRHYTTVGSNINYMRAGDCGKITAVGTVTHRGRRVCVAVVQMTNEAGKLLAEATFTMLCLSEKNEFLPTEQSGASS